MGLAPVKRTKTYEAVADQIKAGIASGEFPPGSKLPSVRALSQQLSVGQAAVREALTALRAMNLVTMRQGEGTFVNQYDPADIARTLETTVLMGTDDVAHLLELRKIVETGNARLAAQRRTEENLAHLRGILASMEADVASFVLGERADWEFHYEVARAAQNPFLVSLMESIAGTIQSALISSRRALYQVPGEPQRLLAQHLKIFQALERQQAQQAEDAMREHLSHVETALDSNAF